MRCLPAYPAQFAKSIRDVFLIDPYSGWPALYSRPNRKANPEAKILIPVDLYLKVHDSCVLWRDVVDLHACCTYERVFVWFLWRLTWGDRDFTDTGQDCAVLIDVLLSDVDRLGPDPVSSGMCIP